MPRKGIAACLTLAILSFESLAADWPTWRGPDRSGVSSETGLLKEWPRGGPKLLWKVEGVGSGYGTPSVAGGRVFLLGSKAGEEFLHAVDVEKGKILWSTKLGIVGENTGPPHPGPKSAPTIDGDLVYALGSDGDLVCADVNRGEVRWRKHLVNDFGGNRGTWAYAESPTIDGDRLICVPGGKTSVMLALDKKSGEVVWKTPIEGGNQAGYVALVPTEAAGGKQYVGYITPGLIGVRAKDGKLLWQYKGNVGGVSAVTPIVHDGYVFTTSSGTDPKVGGDALIKLEPDGDGGVKVKEIYKVRNMTNFHGGAVRIGDHVYGTTGVALVCLEFKTGKKVWDNRSIGQASVMAADGHLYLRSPRSAVALVEANPEKYVEKGRFDQPDRSRYNAFAHPVVAGGRLYLRDADLLLCYDVKAPK